MVAVYKYKVGRKGQQPPLQTGQWGLVLSPDLGSTRGRTWVSQGFQSHLKPTAGKAFG